MAISFVNSTTWSSATSNSSFTINKPSSTANGDFMVAILAIDTFNSSGGDVTVTPPSGWTSESHVYSASNLVIDVMTRTAGSSEPSSWAGSLSGSESPKVSVTSTYRGVASVVADNQGSTGSATSLSTGSVSNPASDNWRVVAGAYTSASVSFALTSNETSNRNNVSSSTLEAGIWDSNTTIGTGSTSRTVNRSQVWESAAAWIGILDAGNSALNASAGTGTASSAANSAKSGVGVKAQTIG